MRRRDPEGMKTIDAALEKINSKWDFFLLNTELNIFRQYYEFNSDLLLGNLYMPFIKADLIVALIPLWQ